MSNVYSSDTNAILLRYNSEMYTFAEWYRMGKPKRNDILNNIAFEEETPDVLDNIHPVLRTSDIDAVENWNALQVGYSSERRTRQHSRKSIESMQTLLETEFSKMRIDLRNEIDEVLKASKSTSKQISPLYAGYDGRLMVCGRDPLIR